MKKILLSLAAAVLAAASMSAQDMAMATEMYNNGATSLQMDDKASALEYFKQALTMGEACGEEGLELVGNCKNIIPQVTLSIAKDMIQSEDYDNAVAQLKAAIEVATEYESADVVEDATSLIPQVYMQKANTLLNAKDFAGAVEAYKQTVEVNPENGNAWLRLGMAYGATGKTAEAEAAYTEAMKYGQEASATKQLSSLYVKQAAAQLKAKNYQGALDAALKSNDYAENATAMQVAGTAASQLKKPAEAITYLESYLSLAPNAKNANQICYTIAALAQSLGDNEKACGYYQKVLTDPKFGPTAQQQVTALKCK